MNAATMVPAKTLNLTSTGTANVQTFALPNNVSAVLLSVETTSARVTFDGTDPSAGGAPSHVFPIAVAPVLIPVGSGATIKFVATAAANSTVQITCLK